MSGGEEEIRLHLGQPHPAASSQARGLDEGAPVLEGDGPQTGGGGQQDEEGRRARGRHVMAPSGCSRNYSARLVVAGPRSWNSARFWDPLRRRLSAPQQGMTAEEDAPDVATLRARIGGSGDGFLSTSGSSELRKAEEENRMLRERQSCKICWESPIDCVFMPCCHRFSCFSCSHRSLREQEVLELPARCPVCRQETTVLPYQQN